MSRIIKTSPPDINNVGEKRWFIGDIEDDLKKVFLHESSEQQRQSLGCARHMLRIYTRDGRLVREQFFNRKHTLNRHLCRMFEVDSIQLGEDSVLQRAA